MRPLIIDSFTGGAGCPQRASRRTRRASCSSTVCRMAAGPWLGVSRPSSRTQRRKRCRLNPKGRRLMTSARSTKRTASSRCSATASRALSVSNSVVGSSRTMGSPDRELLDTLILLRATRRLLTCGWAIVDPDTAPTTATKSSRSTPATRRRCASIWRPSTPCRPRSRPTRRPGTGSSARRSTCRGGPRA